MGKTGSNLTQSTHALQFAARSPKIKRYYQRKAQRTHKMVAKKAVANKLSKACYHMLTRNEPFDVNRAFA